MPQRTVAPVNLDIPNLYETLASLLRQIPRGCVTTYGRLADALGSRSAARWVGEFMLDHTHDDRCGCHRVVRSTGELGRYIAPGDDGRQKARRLVAESIPIEEGHVDLSRCLFENFNCDRPLERLIETQNRLAQSVSLIPFPETPRVVAGVDVSYRDKNRAVAACVLIETANGQVVWSTSIERPVTFPYIPGFLAFRELPVLLELHRKVKAARHGAGLTFVDGNGLLHPRRAGIATLYGLLTDSPSIGVSKSLLLGSVDLSDMPAEETRAVLSDGQVLGMALKAKAMSRPIFVSPGHRIDTNDAVRLTRQLIHTHRLPEPIYQADAISRRAARQDRDAGSGFVGAADAHTDRQSPCPSAENR